MSHWVVTFYLDYHTVKRLSDILMTPQYFSCILTSTVNPRNQTLSCHILPLTRPVLTFMSSGNVWDNLQRLVTLLDAAMSWVRIWRSEMTWTEGSGSSARAGRRDMSSSASVSRAFLSASPQTITSSCLGPQEHTIGKVRWLMELRLFYPNPGFRKRLDEYDACTKVGPLLYELAHLC